MKKFGALILFGVLLILISCTDSLDNSLEQDGSVRIEYSDCSACSECTTLFQCPENAIKVDPRTQTAYIDADKCTGCMECINSFNCPDDAFTLLKDNVPPAQITDFSAVSDTFGRLEIQFIATGDDFASGKAYRYEFIMKDSNGIDIETEFEAPIPQQSGNTELWTIEELSPNSSININLKAIDEVEQSSPFIQHQIMIMGETIDEVPPAAIENIFATSISMNSFLLRWIAVGNDGLEGIADSYIIKISEQEINDDNWDDLQEYEQDIIPQISGSEESLLIEDLNSSTEYFLGIKAADDAGNISTLSEILTVTTTELPDTVPPSEIDDLGAVATSDIVLLSWTATGDDGDEGIADHYEIRKSELEINEGNWENADLLLGVPLPLEAGETQEYSVQDLEPSTLHYFAIKVFDENQNVSPVSNSVSAELLLDILPPADITDLSVYDGPMPNLSTIKIIWTEPGDDGDTGTVDHYEIRYSTSEITTANWAGASVFDDPPQPEEAGNTINCIVTDLNLATIYYFAVKAYDDENNVNNVSNSPAGKIVYQIDTAGCRNCNNCINDCDVNAIHQGPGYKYIEPDECVACGDCSCPFPQNYIHKAVVAY